MLSSSKKTFLSLVTLFSLASTTQVRAAMDLNDIALLGAGAGTFYLLAHHEPAVATNNPARHLLDKTVIMTNNVLDYLDKNKGKIAAAGLVVYLLKNRNNIHIHNLPNTLANLGVNIPFVGPLFVDVKAHNAPAA